MHLPRLLAAGLLLFALPPLALRGQELDDLARLVPRDAVGMIVLPSLDATQAKLAEVLEVVDPELVDQVDLTAILSKAVDTAWIDRKAPLAICFVLAADAMDDDPMPAFVVPVTDVEAFARSVGEDLPRRGHHVLYGIGRTYARSEGVPAIAADLEAADLVVRLDLGRLVTAYGGLIEMALDPENLDVEPELRGLLGSFADTARVLIDSAERLDLVLRTEGTHIDAEFLFRAKEGSPLATSSGQPPQLDRLARLLPSSGYPLSCLVSYDVHSMMKWFEPFLEGFVEMVPEEQRERYREMFHESMAAYRHLGEDALICGGFRSQGMEMVWLSTAKDPDAYLEESMKHADSMQAFGIELEHLSPRKVHGVDVKRARMHIDYETYMGEALEQMPREFVEKLWNEMFGPDGWAMQFASVKDLVVYSMGGADEAFDDMIEAALEERPGQAPANIQAIVDRAGGHPSFVLHLEFREFLAGLMEIVTRVTGDRLAKLETGPPARLSIFTAREGRVHRLGLQFDLGAWMQFLRDLKEL